MTVYHAMMSSHEEQTHVGKSSLPTRAIVRTLLIVSILFYAISLTQPAYHVVNGNPRLVYSGWNVLTIGWLGAFEGKFAWFANPVLVSVWIFAAKGRNSRAIATASVALLLALSFLLNRQISVDEAGHYGQIIHDGLGYWCWLASIALAFVAALVLRWKTRSAS
jgi:hypothetical protein